jgi:hypothetical protein
MPPGFSGNPSGKLSATVPRHSGQLPVYYNTKKSKRHWLTSAKERAYVDLDATPLFGSAICSSGFRRWQSRARARLARRP